MYVCTNFTPNEKPLHLGLLDFPLENMPTLIALLNNAPNVPLYDAINRLYPYKLFLPKEGISSVEDTLETFQLQNEKSTLSKILEPKQSESGTVKIKVGDLAHEIQVPVGVNHQKAHAPLRDGKYVETGYHESFLAELLLSHAVHDFCVIGPKGCGKVSLKEVGLPTYSLCTNIRLEGLPNCSFSLSQC